MIVDTTSDVFVQVARHPDGRECVLETLHDTLWESQAHVPQFLDILDAVGVHPDDTALYARSRSDVRLAAAFDRLYNWTAINRGSDKGSARKAADGMAFASIHVLAGWAAVLTHPSITDVDSWKMHSAISPLVVENRRTPHGWLYAAAGVTAKEARRTDLDAARVMAALRGFIVPAPGERNSAPLLTPQR